MERVDLDGLSLGVTKGFQRLFIEQYREYGFSGHGFLQPYLTTMLLRDVLCKRKPKPYPILLAGTYKGLEQGLSNRFGYTRSRYREF